MITDTYSIGDLIKHNDILKVIIDIYEVEDDYFSQIILIEEDKLTDIISSKELDYRNFEDNGPELFEAEIIEKKKYKINKETIYKIEK